MDNYNSRRDFLRKTALISVLGFGAGALTSYASNPLFVDGTKRFQLPALPYGYDGLEPYIDARTMELHHSKHHQAYVDNLNKALENEPNQNLTLWEICNKISHYPVAVRNNAGGHFNHTFFWFGMSPEGGGQPKDGLAEAINKSFGTFEEFKTKFTAAASSRFGSGWAWLVYNKGNLEIGSTPNQDNPLMDISELKGTPLLALDVWEHAYYLKYLNKRADYITAWWGLVNWSQVEKNYQAAIK